MSNTVRTAAELSARVDEMRYSPDLGVVKADDLELELIENEILVHQNLISEKDGNIQTQIANLEAIKAGLYAERTVLNRISDRINTMRSFSDLQSSREMKDLRS